MNQNSARLLKITDKKKQIRIYLADSQEVVQEAVRRHECLATAAAALGRILTIAGIMGTDLKSTDDRLTLRIRGNGPAGDIVATALSDGSVRGYIMNPKADLTPKYPGKLDVGGLVGNQGIVEVVRDMGLEQPFVGKVELVSGEIAEDMAQYFYQSEQIPSLVSLGVLVNPDLTIQSAEGLLVQALPGADDVLLQQMEEQIHEMGPISRWKEKYGSLEEQIRWMMGKVAYEIIDEVPLSFSCNCSHERLGKLISRFDKDEIQSMTKEGKKIEVVCQFCGEKYYFSPEELLFNEREDQEN